MIFVGTALYSVPLKGEAPAESTREVSIVVEDYSVYFTKIIGQSTLPFRVIESIKKNTFADPRSFVWLIPSFTIGVAEFEFGPHSMLTVIFELYFVFEFPIAVTKM